MVVGAVGSGSRFRNEKVGRQKENKIVNTHAFGILLHSIVPLQPSASSLDTWKWTLSSNLK